MLSLGRQDRSVSFARIFIGNILQFSFAYSARILANAIFVSACMRNFHSERDTNRVCLSHINCTAFREMKSLSCVRQFRATRIIYARPFHRRYLSYLSPN